MPKPATSRHRLVPFSCTSSPPTTAVTVHDWLARLPLLPGRPACSHTWARVPMTCEPSTTNCGLVSFVALTYTLGCVTFHANVAFPSPPVLSFAVTVTVYETAVFGFPLMSPEELMP